MVSISAVFMMCWRRSRCCSHCSVQATSTIETINFIPVSAVSVLEIIFTFIKLYISIHNEVKHDIGIKTMVWTKQKATKSLDKFLPKKYLLWMYLCPSVLPCFHLSSEQAFVFALVYPDNFASDVQHQSVCTRKALRGVECLFGK